MSGLDRKYVVFKADEFDVWAQTVLPYDNLVAMPETIDDAIVLRKQDIFTSSALYEYAGQIRTAIELVQKARDSGISLDDLTAELRVLADQFADEAESAETEFARKIPD